MTEPAIQFESHQIGLQFSADPTVQDIFQAHIFEEPLVPIGGDPTPTENAALATALLSHSKRSGAEDEDFSSLTGFLEAYPKSPWNAGLLTNLGLQYYKRGRYSKALEAWCQAWNQAKTAATDLNGNALANRAIGELAYLYARLGRVTELEALLKSVEGRVFCGPATERIVSAREGLWYMRNHPEISFRCGPMALHCIMLAAHPDDPQSKLIDATASTQQGLSLQQVAELSCKLGLDFQMAFRDKGSASSIIVPAVVHFNLGHFAAMIRCEGGRYLLEDPTFKDDVWVTKETLEAEASGYFLVPPGELPEDWRIVKSREAEAVWGRGFVGDPPPDEPPGPCDHTSDRCQPCQEGGSKGMAVARVHLFNVSLNINDEPIGYAPPVGPAVRFTVRYNQRDDQLASTFNYSNFGWKWTYDWLAFIQDDPRNPKADVKYYMMGGGVRKFTGFNPSSPGDPSKGGEYAFHVLDQTKLKRTQSKAPDGSTLDSYEMIYPDGSKKIFAKSDKSTEVRKIFLTKLIDPFGNAISIEYDAQLRMVTIEDAIGQKTTVSYELPPPNHFKITKVTDPFGRFAEFKYDESSGRLKKITDVMGLTSEFDYGPDGTGSTKGDFIKTLTTPYGDTKFILEEFPITYVRWGTGGTYSFRSLEILYPDGDRERVEFNQNHTLGIPESDPPQSVPGGMATTNNYPPNRWLTYRNTYHWDRQACAQAYGDHTKARIYHWLHGKKNATPVGILESVKEPLEGRVWYEYAGQPVLTLPESYSMHVGSSNKPIHVGRVLDDGSTQLYTYEYDDFGHVTKEIDPVGRTISYIYDPDNGIDLLEVRQTRLGQDELLMKMTYYPQHLLWTMHDAAGQTTTYTYNKRGQLVTETNARGDTTTYTYDDTNGFRISVDGPVPSGIRTEWTPDKFGRIRTKTNDPIRGYTLTFEHDDLDRLTKITYPDGTFDQFVYTRLDLTLMKDRAGRQTSFEYNSNRQMIKRTDPLNRATDPVGDRATWFEWCKCGALRRLTDPMGRTTTWLYDVQGRVKSKEYANGSKITYLYENTTSRISQKIDEKFQVTQYNYNQDNTLSSKSYTNAAIATPAVTFTYDPNYIRTTSMTDGTGTTYYSYIPITAIPTLGAGRLKSEDGPLPKDTITYGYDELGRRVSTAINGGVPSVVALDNAGRVASATNALGLFIYGYDPGSIRRSSLIYPNGQTANWGYAGILQDQMLEAIIYKHKDAPISELVYEYDVPERRIRRITRYSEESPFHQASIYDFGYDDADQLKSSTHYQGANIISAFEYTYDPAGNRLTENIKATPSPGGIPPTTSQFSYNALNELTSSDGASGYQLATYGWDAEHRLASVKSGNRQTEFRYDGFGRCVVIRHLVDASEVESRRLVWCDNDICEERTQDGAIRKRFFEQGMQLIDGPTTHEFFYTRDHLGSIRELIYSGTGNVVARYYYDPFGRRTLLDGGLESDFGFAGMFWIPEIGLNLTRFRAYDPIIGRWLSRDPLNNAELEEGPNLFAYVRNNPVNLTDPLGLRCCQDEEDAREKAEARDVEMRIARGRVRKLCIKDIRIKPHEMRFDSICIPLLDWFDNRIRQLDKELEAREKAYDDCMSNPCIEPTCTSPLILP